MYGDTCTGPLGEALKQLIKQICRYMQIKKPEDLEYFSEIAESDWE